MKNFFTQLFDKIFEVVPIPEQPKDVPKYNHPDKYVCDGKNIKLRIVKGHWDNPNVFIIQYLETISANDYESWWPAKSDILNDNIPHPEEGDWYHYREYRSLKSAEKAIEKYLKYVEPKPRVIPEIVREYSTIKH